jgi:medium-chain acyl-[acyl-carrier-protein] hydrolase
LVIKFDKEIQYGEEVTCQATYAPEELTSSHALTHHGDVMALCEVKWREM